MSSFDSFAEHNRQFKYDPAAPRAPRKPRLQLRPEVEVLIKLVGSAVMFLVGALLLWRTLMPASEFEAPPESISVRNLRVESADGTWITGMMVNQSPRNADRVVFQLTYRGNGHPMLDYVVQEGLRSGEFRTFRVLARAGTSGRTVVTGEPAILPFHVQWSPSSSGG